MTSHDHSSANHSHGSGVHLSEGATSLLRRGTYLLLDMTDGLEFRPLISERYPLPLAQVDYPAVPSAADLREDVRASIEDDPMRVLLKTLALVELYECNQPDTPDHLLNDMRFINTCFGSKRCNGWIAMMGSTGREQLEATINEQWQFKFFSGPERPTGIYVLLSMLARYAFVYGRIEPGESHDLGHFVEDYCPGLIVCSGKMTDLELTLSLAAMRMGVPAIVPDDYPFPLGKTIRATAVEDIAACVVGFPNIRRLLDTPDIPQLPDYCDPANAQQEITPAVTWGDNDSSFLIVQKGKVKSPGFKVTGKSDKSIGVVITIDAEPMDEWDREFIERSVVQKLALIDGVAVEFDSEKEKFAIHQAEDADLTPERIGEVLAAAVPNALPKLKDKVHVEVILDAKRLAKLAPGIRAEKLARQQVMDTATEDSIDWFLGCTGCSPFAPDHVCILTPQRRPQCGRDIGTLKTNALYGYDDMSNIHHSRLQAGVNSFQVIDKGRCIDELRGEWTGINAHAARMTDGRTTRVQLHCLDDVPHTGCGCFQIIFFKTDKPCAGIGIMNRGFDGPCADGRTWADLHYALAGKQAPGITGGGYPYLTSPKFLQAHGGWDSVVWVSPRIAEYMAEHSTLPAGQLPAVCKTAMEEQRQTP